MKTVLIAGIANTDPPYPDLVRCSHATWDSREVPGVDTVFYFNREWDASKLSRTIAVDCDGGFFTLGKRDLLAYRWCLDNKPDWQYMARINASCYVRKQQLLDYCQTVPDRKLFRGVAYNGGDGRRFLWGGAQYIISRDVVEKIWEHRDKWNHLDMEDVSMSNLVRDIRLEDGSSIPLDSEGCACSVNKRDDRGDWLCIWYCGGQSGGFEFTDWRDMAKAPHFIRVKQDLRRHMDLEVMQELHKAGI